ncbi:hypothetical protein LOD99_977 [Oopsacas minuta]|uniref:SWIM-type domain-containing protein n=1 Tax=Oopsacas minuta TaxID=111878 RepID=A0AAV7K2U1_9METZ|nr:hypothetical protein LOD99_977 [Oopsacas minuta]
MVPGRGRYPDIGVQIRGPSVRIIIYANSNSYFVFILVEREGFSGGTNKEKLTSMDLGLSKVFAKSSRKTTLTSCTCLFPSSWGLTCRHMLIVYHHEKITNIHDKAIVDFWKWLDTNVFYISILLKRKNTNKPSKSVHFISFSRAIGSGFTAQYKTTT